MFLHACIKYIVWIFAPTACSDVDRWPPPVPGKTLHLPIMGIVMKVILIT